MFRSMAEHGWILMFIAILFGAGPVLGERSAGGENKPVAAETKRAASPSGVPALLRKIPLPGVEGRIDHFAWDAKRNRLFVAALGNNTVEVLDMTSGTVAATIRNLPEPQGVAIGPDLDPLGHY